MNLFPHLFRTKLSSVGLYFMNLLCISLLISESLISLSIFHTMIKINAKLIQLEISFQVADIWWLDLALNRCHEFVGPIILPRNFFRFF